MLNAKGSDLNFEIYTKMFLDHIPLAKIVNKHTVNGRCILCGDSKKNNRRTRLYLLRERQNVPNIVVCHNCHYSRSAKTFFDEKFPDAMKEYNTAWAERDMTSIQKLKDENPFTKYEEELQTEEERWVSHTEEVRKSKEVIKKFFESYTNPAIYDRDAYGYLKSRMVPDGIAESCRIIKPEYWNREIFRYAYLSNYILFPFLDLKDLQPYFFNARKYKKMEFTSMAKYLTCPFPPDDVNVNYFYNELMVTRNEPVIICEGTISSINLPNCVSTNGIGKQTDDFIKIFEWKFGGSSNIIYANDNEMVDHDAMEKCEYLLSKGKRVFLWSLFAADYPTIAKYKDFNDLCVAAGKDRLPAEIIEKYAVDNMVSLLKAKTNVRR
jgi:hypothetical protein